MEPIGEKNQTRSNNKIELSLSAIMFFSPLIQNLLKKNNLTQDEKTFIQGFIKIGYINIILVTITIILQIIFYINHLEILQTISFVLVVILASILSIGSIYAISNKPIIKKHNIKNKNDNPKNINKLQILLNYIPLYNVYLWYTKHDFKNPDITLKESLIRWSLYSIIFLTFSNPSINRIILTILGIRIIILLNDISLGPKATYTINKLFQKNPEEIRGYVSGTVLSITNKKKVIENINIQKNYFKFLFKIDNKQILLEYIILLLISIYGIYKGYILGNFALIFAIIFIICRYTIMIVKWNHIPHLPLLKGLTQIFFNHKQ